jgi:drug/metabolite transporter (DMT)-like permease
VLWALLASFLFALMGLLVKLVSAELHVAEIVFYRSLAGLAVLGTVTSLRGRALLPVHGSFSLHLSRGVVGFIAMYLMFYSFAHLPVALALAFTQTAPLFFCAFGFALGTKVSRREIWAIAAGFIGVLVLLNPHLGAGETLGLVAGLAAGALAGVVQHQVRALTAAGEAEDRIVIFFLATSAVCSGLWAAYAGFSELSLRALIGVAALGVVATGAQLALTRAFATGLAAVVSGFGYASLVFATLFEIVLFSSYPTLQAGMGLVLIASAGTVLALWRSP